MKHVVEEKLLVRLVNLSFKFFLLMGSVRKDLGVGDRITQMKRNKLKYFFMGYSKKGAQGSSE